MRRWAGGRALPALQGRGILQRGVPGGGVEGRAQITVRQDARRAATRAAQQALGGGEACHGHRRRRGRRDAGPPHAQVREHATRVRRVQCVAAAQQRQRQAAPPGHRAGGRARKSRPPRWGACTKEQAARRREGIAGRCAVPVRLPQRRGARARAGCPHKQASARGTNTTRGLRPARRPVARRQLRAHCATWSRGGSPSGQGKRRQACTREILRGLLGPWRTPNPPGLCAFRSPPACTRFCLTAVRGSVQFDGAVASGGRQPAHLGRPRRHGDRFALAAAGASAGGAASGAAS